MESWPFRRVFRVGWWILCTATLCALPLTIWEFKNQGWSPHYQAWFIGGIFVIMTIPISVYEVAMHTEYYTRPRLQRHVIRILWMVPIYSIDAWLALRFKDARLYLDPVRECYEAYVIYNFYAYLMNFLEDELGCVDEYLSLKAPIPHLWPFNKCIQPWKMGADYLWQTKKGVANYVIIRPLCTALALITDHFGDYGAGELRPNKAYPFLAFATNCSQMWALYCLVMFYHAFKDELHPIRPLAKFLCIKAVVFLTFWQGLTLNILVATGAIHVNEQFTTYTAADVAEGLQDFLICIEMFLAALAHAYAFPPRDYMDPNIPTKGFLTNVRFMFDLRDVVIDVQGVLEDHLQTTTAHGRKAIAKTVQGVVQTPGQILSMISSAAGAAITGGGKPGGSGGGGGGSGVLAPGGYAAIGGEEEADHAGAALLARARRSSCSGDEDERGAAAAAAVAAAAAERRRYSPPLAGSGGGGGGGCDEESGEDEIAADRETAPLRQRSAPRSDA